MAECKFCKNKGFTHICYDCEDGNAFIPSDCNNCVHEATHMCSDCVGSRLWQPRSAHDAVNSPIHYTSGKFECVDVIEDIVSQCKTPYEGWVLGSLIKYLWRYRLKNGAEDLKKAQWYLTRLMK